MKEETLVFADKKLQPDLALALHALGKNATLLEQVMAECGITDSIWKFYGASSGWTLQCRSGKKNLFYIQLAGTGFNVWFTLGKAAKQKVLEDTQLAAVHEELSAAREYTEGTSFCVKVRAKKDLAPIVKLAEIKAGK
ncbi:DUF3788 family protein [Filimonas effusa]|uniref:DUF3788 family protein n=1 Tax=Filimonas effusa TaxID=2508721 RepID=A0A4Q1D3E1_9BACT|nr:DUF3788 family protein [Filimonas effusa]RXK81932.1 DUF3788 family protein [Filimonas effusa]